MPHSCAAFCNPWDQPSFGAECDTLRVHWSCCWTKGTWGDQCGPAR